MKIRTRIILSLFLMLVLGPCFGDTVVVPNSQATTQGSSGNSHPFFLGSIDNSLRWQQVYGAADFSALGGPQLITEIAFRPRIGQAAFNRTIPNVQISLSTTNSVVDSLSMTFANNTGADEIVVYNGSLSLSSAATGYPRDFDITIQLQTPFLYDPSAGNLLLDVRNFGGVSTPRVYFDFIEEATDSISRVYTDDYRDQVGDAAADYSSTGGLVTRFTTVDPILIVQMNIKFCGNPNAFNCKKKGVLPVTIFGLDDFDVTEIDQSTLALCKAADLGDCTGIPVAYSLADRGDPTSDLGASECAMIEEEEQDYLNPDGNVDLDVAFDAREVQQLLESFCEGERGGTSEPLVVTGETTGGLPFMSDPIPNPGVDQLIKVN